MVRLITGLRPGDRGVATRRGSTEASSSLEALIRERELRQGDGIYVTDETGQRIKGKFSDLSATSLTVDTPNGDRSFEASAIRRIELQDSIESGIWIGAGLAVAGSYISCYAESRSNEFCYVTAYAFLPAVGVAAFVGAIVDATRHRKLYEAAGTKRVDGGSRRIARGTQRAGIHRMVSRFESKNRLQPATRFRSDEERWASVVNRDPAAAGEFTGHLRCMMSIPPHCSSRYSATSRRWQWSGVSSLHSRQPFASRSLDRVCSMRLCPMSVRNRFSYVDQSPFPFL